MFQVFAKSLSYAKVFFQSLFPPNIVAHKQYAMYCSCVDGAFQQCELDLLAKESDLILNRTPTVSSPLAVFIVPYAAFLLQILSSWPLLSQILFRIAYYVCSKTWLASPYSSCLHAKSKKSFCHRCFLFHFLISVYHWRIFIVGGLCFLQSQA